MLLKLIAAFTVIPFLELYLLIKIGSYIGTFTTIGIVIITGVAGAALAKAQGIRVLQDLQATVQRGQMPSHQLIQGLLVLVGGLTLLTPGFLTDALGLTMLLPATRKLYATLIERYVQQQIKHGQWQVVSSADEDADVIDVTPK